MENGQTRNKAGRGTQHTIVATAKSGLFYAVYGERQTFLAGKSAEEDEEKWGRGEGLLAERITE
jgi:hypothetical protein